MCVVLYNCKAPLLFRLPGKDRAKPKKHVLLPLANHCSDNWAILSFDGNCTFNQYPNTVWNFKTLSRVSGYRDGLPKFNTMVKPFLWHLHPNWQLLLLVLCHANWNAFWRMPWVSIRTISSVKTASNVCVKKHFLKLASLVCQLCGVIFAICR